MKNPKDRPRAVLDRPFYSPAELARIAGVHPSTVLNWIRSGRVAGVRLSPRIYRIPLASAIRLLEPERYRPPRIIERPFARVNIAGIERELRREHRPRRRRPS
jgi:predicted site-specific integrase-resolvase